jgi:hypothetical protein
VLGKAIVPGKVHVKNLGEPTKVSQNFWMGRKMDTMACTWHVAEHNGFLWFAQMGIWILNNGGWLHQVADYSNVTTLCFLGWTEKWTGMAETRTPETEGGRHFRVTWKMCQIPL